MDWTPEAEQRVKEEREIGRSASEIADTLALEKLGQVTRSAVIGKIHRMKLPRRACDAPKAPKKLYLRARKPSGEVVPRVRKRRPRPRGYEIMATRAANRRYRENYVAKLREMFATESVPAELASGAKPFLELRPGQCKWPFGDPRKPDFCMCAKPVRRDKPYCDEHCEIAYDPAGAGY